MTYVFNPYTGELDAVQSLLVLDDRYVKLNPTANQTISGHDLILAGGNLVMDSTEYIEFDGTDTRIRGNEAVFSPGFLMLDGVSGASIPRGFLASGDWRFFANAGSDGLGIYRPSIFLQDNGLHIDAGPSITTVGSAGKALLIEGTLTEASSGTHPLLAGVWIGNFDIETGDATVTNSATLYIDSALPVTVTGENYSIWVADGLVRFDDTLKINVATATSEALILKTTDDNSTKNLLEIKDSGGNVLTSINPDGHLLFGSASGSPAFIEVNSSLSGISPTGFRFTPTLIATGLGNVTASVMNPVIIINNGVTAGVVSGLQLTGMNVTNNGTITTLTALNVAAPSFSGNAPTNLYALTATGTIFANGDGIFTGDLDVGKTLTVDGSESVIASFKSSLASPAVMRFETTHANAFPLMQIIDTGSAEVGKTWNIENGRIDGALTFYRGGVALLLDKNRLVGINETTPTAQLHVVNITASNVVQIIKVASSQSANAWELRNSSNVVMTFADKDGDVVIGEATQQTNADTLQIGGGWTFKESSAPTADSGYAKMWTESNNELFLQTGDGATHLLHGDAFSEIWFHAASSVEVAISTEDAMTKIDSFTVVGHQDDLSNVVGSTANNDLTLSAIGGGEYEVSFHMSMTATGGADKEMVIAMGITLATPKDITDVTDDLVTPIVITSVAHGLEDGDMVEIVGVLVNTAANGSFIVDSKTDDTFEIVALDGTATTGNGDYDAGTPTGDVTIEYPGNMVVHREVRGASIGALSATGLHVLFDNDVLALYVANLDGTTNLTVAAVSFDAFRIGD